jgi:hypothetical protein
LEDATWYSLIAFVPNAKNTNTKRLLMGKEDQREYSHVGGDNAQEKSACTSP